MSKQSNHELQGNNKIYGYQLWQVTEESWREWDFAHIKAEFISHLS